MDDLHRLRAAVLHRDRAPYVQAMQHFQQDLNYDQIINNRGRGRIYRYQGPPPPRGALGAHPNRPYQNSQRIKVEEDVLSYSGKADDPPGVWKGSRSIDYYGRYFEIEILDVGDAGQIGIGLVPDRYALNVHPGVEDYSIGYMAETGKILINHGHGGVDMSQSAPPCGMGDRMGVGIRTSEDPSDKRNLKVFFTRNGQEVKTVNFHMDPVFLLPCVSMQSEGEEVLLRIDAQWNPEDVTQMVVDCGEEDWVRLDDIRLNGTVLEYTGRGRTIHDVGLAQAKYPLDTTNHYFEFEIVDPGDKCYVAIGLAKKNYPMRRHPGWNNGSIAYHADDGKLFHGSGMGVPFGPKCLKGDTMGCGIYFPLDYDSEVEGLGYDDEEDRKYDEDDDEEDEDDDDEEDLEIILGLRDSDDEKDNKGRRGKGKGTKVSVFFTKNGKFIGSREVNVFKGGFYPTIGMLSCNEKVRVDLRPMTG